VFLEAAPADRLEPLYVLAITAGSRQGELLGLKWEDVDLEDVTLQVRRTLSNGTFTAPKTAKSRRSVKLTARALESLKHHRQRQLDRVTRKETDPRIWRTQKGNRFELMKRGRDVRHPRARKRR
jgi:integrase